MQNAMCGRKLTLHIPLNTPSPSWNMVVAASCCRDAFLQQGQGSRFWVYGNMDGAKYRTVLKENLLESAKDLRLERSFTFQQDNKPKHTARATMEWFRSKHIHVLEWPSQSPDLNPIENLWQDLKTAVHRHSPSNQTKLKLFCKEEWANNSVSICELLVETYPKRFAAVIAAKGGSTKYWLMGVGVTLPPMGDLLLPHITTPPFQTGKYTMNHMQQLSATQNVVSPIDSICIPKYHESPWSNPMNIKHWNTVLFFTFYTTVTVNNTLLHIKISTRITNPFFLSFFFVLTVPNYNNFLSHCICFTLDLWPSLEAS